MNNLKIQIFGQIELVQYIESGSETVSHLVSIGNPKSRSMKRSDTELPPIFKKTFEKVLRQAFFDVEKKEHLGSMRPKRIPMKKDVRKVIRFFNRYSDTATGFCIHCWRGISRSTAIALGYLYLIHKDEQKAVDELKKIQPEAAPHPGIVKYFDELLGSHLSSKSDQLREIQYRKMREWFFNEIEDGDALLEVLEVLDD